jgi:fibronectin type 3 domain-containing protein
MAAATCATTDVYLSHGRNVAPAAGDTIVALRSHVLAAHPTWAVDLPGAGACSLNATDNVQGHVLNGVAAGSVCGTAASSYTGRFIHIEQDPNFRNTTDWIGPVEATWPVGLPAAPTGVTAVAGNAQVSLGWTAVAGATTYGVHRSPTSGGPYTPIAAGVTGTSYLDTGVVNGVTYYWVATAVNAAEESGASSQVSATPRAPTVPPAPTGLTATAAKRKIALTWTAASGATSYTVKRGTSTGGPYTTVAAGVTGTSYTRRCVRLECVYYVQ